MSSALQEANGLRIAVEGCGHGTLDAIYESVKTASKARGWDGVDILIIGGDFQAVRNASDLTVMACPVKFREIGDFHGYYSSEKSAPYLTIFVGGNHEASSYLWELYYGGWVAPNIYYMGAANVVRVGGIRIAGMSGIWKGYNYNKPHYERLPYSQDDVRSIYHIRELDVRKLLQLKSQVDIGISHDWPRAIENHGNAKALWKLKPDFEKESRDGTLGSTAAAHAMDRLRPSYWFSAHMHCKFAASKVYGEDEKSRKDPEAGVRKSYSQETENTTSILHNTDEIDLDMDDDETTSSPPSSNKQILPSSQDESISQNGHGKAESTAPVPDDVRAQLPAAFFRPNPRTPRQQPGQPIPPGIKNKVVRFLALDKCLPGRKFLQLLEVPHQAPMTHSDNVSIQNKVKFEYDPEWLAITRVFANDLILGGDKNALTATDLGEAIYAPLIEKELGWVESNIVEKGILEIPENFTITASVHHAGTAEIISEGPAEYNNPQTQRFCELVGIENKFFMTEEEKNERQKRGPAPPEERFGRGNSGGRRGFGHGGRRGRGRGRGFGGGERGRGRAW